MNVILLGLTGFGNQVLETLLGQKGVFIQAVFSKTYKDPFPYYEELPLDELCLQKNIKCFTNIAVSGKKGVEIIRELQPDLILVATYKEIISPEVIAIPSQGIINFHPSLLPKYRGPCPTNAVILNGERETGVTIHYVTELLDKGDILCQKSLSLEDTETDGMLRKRLAELAGAMVPEVISLFEAEQHPHGKPQKDADASLAPRLKEEEGYLEGVKDEETLLRKMRGLNPVPGTSIEIEGERIPVSQIKEIAFESNKGICKTETGIQIHLKTKGYLLN